jgi:K+-sensing histidine kinase KdpD
MHQIKQRYMKVRNASHWAPRGLRAWYFSVFALVIASGVRLLLHPLLGPIMPGTAYFIAAALIEYFFGMAPALAVMTVGLVIADFLFVPPYQQIGVLDQSDVALIVSLPLVSMLVICLIERLRRSEFRAELIALVAQSRYDMLLRADNERAIASRAADETHRLIRNLPRCHDDIIPTQALVHKAARCHGESDLASAPKTKPAATAPGMHYEHVHSNDISRLSSTPARSSSHRTGIDVDVDVEEYELMDGAAKRF